MQNALFKNGFRCAVLPVIQENISEGVVEGEVTWVFFKAFSAEVGRIEETPKFYIQMGEGDIGQGGCVRAS